MFMRFYDCNYLYKLNTEQLLSFMFYSILLLCVNKEYYCALRLCCQPYMVIVLSTLHGDCVVKHTW